MRFLFVIALLYCCTGMQAQENTNNNWPGELIEGIWIMPTKNGAIGETWKRIDDNYYQGKGFMIKGTDTLITEQVSLRKTADGIFYISTVEDQNNKQPISFKLSSSNINLFIFENPEHDFPKRIVYEFTDSITLHAYIDDGINGKKKHHFYYKKVK
jgi:Domain of unknown function (DUF6265)